MIARLHKLAEDLRQAFWLVPGLLVLAGTVGALCSLTLDSKGLVPQFLIQDSWIYNGGATGARTLLGAVASSTIDVAGTVFSITIAALSLAAGQMGPRLLRNFVRDRGNQVTLGIFLATFSYSLMVLRSVRTETEGLFVPHLSLTIAILLAFVCVGTLVFFVGHMSGRINVDTVIDLVSRDVRDAMRRLTSDTPMTAAPPAMTWRDTTPVADPRHGYLQQLDADGLADWAAEHGTAIRLLVRPGEYVFPGTPIALLARPAAGAGAAITAATALSSQRISSIDLEYAVRQLVEVAVRALSPGINDPNTAISVLDRLGSALCDLVPRHLPTGVSLRNGRVALVAPAVTYDGLLDAMFHMIRQNAAGSPAVLIRVLEVLTVVASVEKASERVASLQRHADLVRGDGDRAIATPEDRDELRQRHERFEAARSGAWPPGTGGDSRCR